jgi:DNA-binding beta-propeller fold protein YncE
MQSPAAFDSVAPILGEVVLSHAMERSILQLPNVSDFLPFAVAGRLRRATCSGVAWFGSNHLAVVNTYGQHLRVYRIDPGGGEVPGNPGRLELLHELSEGIHFPEDVAVSRDGTLLAVSHSMNPDTGVTLHSVDPASQKPGPASEPLRRGATCHGLSFSPDSRHLAITKLGPSGYVEVVRTGSTLGTRTCLVENRHDRAMAKTVAFSHDGLFVAIGSSFALTPDLNDTDARSVVAIHQYDQRLGVISPVPLVELHGTGDRCGSLEICKFLPTATAGKYRILGTSQSSDSVAVFGFDPAALTLVRESELVTGLSFPHGIDVSPDGRFVAVTNYGDDTLCIVRLAAPADARGSSVAPADVTPVS